MAKNVKFSMSLSEDLNNFCVRESKRMGITKSAFIAVCIDSIKKQQDSFEMTNQASEIVRVLKSGELDQNKA